MDYEGKIYGKIGKRFFELETWHPVTKLPPIDKDVLCRLKDGTFLMAKYGGNFIWGFYFSDVGFRFDSEISKQVTDWLPLSSLPPIKNT